MLQRRRGAAMGFASQDLHYSQTATEKVNTNLKPRGQRLRAHREPCVLIRENLLHKR